MKKLIFIFSILVSLMACDNEPQQKPAAVKIPTAQDSIQNYKGEFISVGDAAVLKGNRFIFQVHMDSLAKVLMAKTDDYKLKSPNVLPVEVKGKVIRNVQGASFSQKIELKEIVKIDAEKKADTTKIEE
ncbi:MAG: hypothetical protein WCD31_07470 [Gillisia sp.]